MAEPDTELRYPHVLRAVYETPWAILPQRLATILSILHERAAGYRPGAEELEARIAAGREDHATTPHAGPGGRSTKSVAVLPVLGVLTQRGGMDENSEPLTSTARLQQTFRQLVADPSIGAIVLEVDSPGGTVDGVQEFADEILSARGAKPIVAVANSMAASAAYWLASAAEELVVTPSGEVGSIGVFAAHQDLSERLKLMGVNISLISAGKYKVESNPYQPLTPEARDYIQTRVDDYYQAFTKAVGRGRGISAAAVRSGFGQGRMVGANEAVKLGMADAIGTLEDTIARLAKGKMLNRRASLEAPEPTSAELELIELEADVEVAVSEAWSASLDLRRRRLRNRALG